MAAAKFVEHLASRAGTPAGYVFNSLADSLVNIGARGGVEQPLVCFCVLHDGLCLTVDGQDQGALALLFFSCFKNLPELRRKFVSDWMSFVISYAIAQTRSLDSTLYMLSNGKGFCKAAADRSERAVLLAVLIRQHTLSIEISLRVELQKS
jgi:hypothetical protein